MGNPVVDIAQQTGLQSTFVARRGSASSAATLGGGPGRQILLALGLGEMAEDRFEKALSESDASRLIHDAKIETKESRDRQILEASAHRIASLLDEIMSGHESFGQGPGVLVMSFPDELTVSLKYVREGKTLRMDVTGNLSLDYGDLSGIVSSPGVLIGDSFHLNSAELDVRITRSDTFDDVNDTFRYSLQPVSKLISIEPDQFRDFVEALIRRF